MVNNVGKLTNQRKYILEVLCNIKMPITIEEVLEKIENKYSKKIAFSTAFRNLEMLAKNKIVTKDYDANGTAIYMINDENHKHNHILKCIKCKKEIIMEECPYMSINKSIEKETGFRIKNDNNIELEGYCNDCKRSN